MLKKILVNIPNVVVKWYIICYMVKGSILPDWGSLVGLLLIPPVYEVMKDYLGLEGLCKLERRVESYINFLVNIFVLCDKVVSV